MNLQFRFKLSAIAFAICVLPVPGGPCNNITIPFPNILSKIPYSAYFFILLLATISKILFLT